LRIATAALELVPCPLGVNNGPEGPETPLPVFPYEPTSSGRADWSVSCQQRKSKLPPLPHHTLASVRARHIGELTFKGCSRRPAVERFLFQRGRDQCGVRRLCRAVDDKACADPAANGYIASTASLAAFSRRHSALWRGPDVVGADCDPKKPNRCAYAP